MGVSAIRRALLAGCLIVPHVLGQPTSMPVRTRVMVGIGASAILEEHQPAFPTRDSTFHLLVPAGIDPSTVVVTDPSGRARVQEIRRRVLGPQTPQAAYVDTHARAESAGVDVEQVFEIALRSTDTRARAMEVLYSTDRMAWRAHYDLTVRGDVANHLEPLSVDFEGRYFISNGLARTFTAARVSVRGPDALVESYAAASSPRGFLSLDVDSPLADLWRSRAAPIRPPQMYAVPEPVTLPGGQVTAVRFASARRMSAERVFVMDSDQLLLSGTGAPRPLRQWLSLLNERRVGLGMPLPPGTASLVAGVGRGSIRQEAVLNHTPAGGRLRVDLGPSPAVVGARRSLGRAVARTGFTEETVELRIVNQLPSAVRVEVVERPPVPLAWDVVRSSRAYEVIARRLHMEMNIPARSEERITYTVRLTEPEG